MAASCLDVIKSHRSIRSFRPEPIPDDDLRAILEAARRHASPWNLQPVHVTLVRDKGLKEKLASALWEQWQITQAPVFLIFSVDYAKVTSALKEAGKPLRKPGFVDYVQGVISATIALSWTAAVAEGLGYAVNFIAVYGRPCRVAEILGLPELVVPVAGLLIGKPAEIPDLTPREPMEGLVGYDGYGNLHEKAKAYAATMEGFIEKVARVLGPGGPVGEMDKEVLECVRKRGFTF